MTVDEIFARPTKEVDDWLRNEMLLSVSLDSIQSESDLQQAGQLLILLANRYSYLATCYASLKYRQRYEKDHKNKAKSDELIDKRELLYWYMDSIGKMRDSVSRLITIRKMENEELKSLHLI